MYYTGCDYSMSQGTLGSAAQAQCSCLVCCYKWLLLILTIFMGCCSFDSSHAAYVDCYDYDYGCHMIDGV